jgi:hypothetical protein
MNTMTSTLKEAITMLKVDDVFIPVNSIIVARNMIRNESGLENEFEESRKENQEIGRKNKN